MAARDNSDNSSSSSPKTPLKGSELLLRKLPLYAQAQRYLRHSPANPLDESSTLSYGAATYPILSLVRACRTATLIVNSHDYSNMASGNVDGNRFSGEARAALAQVRTFTSEALQSPFTDIANRRLYNVPLPRRWQSRSGSGSGGAANAEGTEGDASEDAVTRERLKAEAELLSAAVAAGTGPDYVEPSVRTVALALARASASAAPARHDKRPRTEDDGDDGEEEEGDAVSKEGKTSESRTELDRWFAATKEVVEDSCRNGSRGRRGHTKPNKATGPTRSHSLYSQNAVCSLVASPEETVMLRAARTTTAAAATATATAASGGSCSAMSLAVHSGPVPAEQWGPRLAALIAAGATSFAGAAAGGPALDAAHRKACQDQQQQVAAYLRRVAWVERQRNAAFAVPRTVDVSVAAASKWTQLSAAERVRAEMEHTNEQRSRFRRERRGSGGGGDGDE